MLSILNITLPIFLLIGAGYFSVRCNVLDGSHVSGLARYVVMIAFPTLILHALSDLKLSETVISDYLLSYGIATIILFAASCTLALKVFREFAFPTLILHALSDLKLSETVISDYLLSYGIATIILFAASCTLALKVFRESPAAAALNGIGTSYSNSSFIGFSILSILLGPSEAAVFLGMNLLIENFLVLLPALVLAQADEPKKNAWAILLNGFARLLRTPLIIGLLLGFGCAVLNIRIPGVLERFFSMISVTAAPIAIFVIGASLYGVRIRSNIKEALTVSAAKLAILPALVMALMQCFPAIPDQARAAALIMACSPCSTIYSMLGKQFGRGSDTASNLIVCTLLSFLSLSAALMLSQRFYGLSA